MLIFLRKDNYVLYNFNDYKMFYEKDVYVFICMIYYKGRKIDMYEINNLLDDGCNF